MIHYITRYVNLILAIDFFSKSILSGENYIKMFRTFYYCMTGLKKEQKKKKPQKKMINKCKQNLEYIVHGNKMRLLIKIQVNFKVSNYCAKN